jgi:hypothetical protein
MCCGNAAEVLSHDAALSRRLDTAVINLSNRSTALPSGVKKKLEDKLYRLAISVGEGDADESAWPGCDVVTFAND